MRADHFSNFDNLFAAGIQFPVPYILFDTAGKEDGVLGHNANLLP